MVVLIRALNQIIVKWGTEKSYFHKSRPMSNGLWNRLIPTCTRSLWHGNKVLAWINQTRSLPGCTMRTSTCASTLTTRSWGPECKMPLKEATSSSRPSAIRRRRFSPSKYKFPIVQCWYNPLYLMVSAYHMLGTFSKYSDYFFFFFTFIWPCTVTNFFIIKPTSCTVWAECSCLTWWYIS